MRGSFDFFLGAATAVAGNGALCTWGGVLAIAGGALCTGGGGTLCAGGGFRGKATVSVNCCGGATGGGLGRENGGGGCVGTFDEVDEPVGPVSLGNTTVGADDEEAIVSPKSGVSLGAGVLAIVAFGSNNVSVARRRPPSTVQNFWLSSGKVRLHFGQRFMREIGSL
jgi:hypothetical protein